MPHSPLFKALLKKCTEQPQYIGLGNPEAKMLFVGKEAGIDSNADNPHGWASSWLSGQNDYAKRYVPVKKHMLNRGHTWQHYQLLYETIMTKLGHSVEKKHPYEITFVEDVFTTELSNLHASRSHEAKQLAEFATNLKTRKDVFWKDPFIARFPIVLIFASDRNYIETTPGEVCETFNVRFIETKSIGSSRMWLHREHHDASSPRLLIHTRQLANGASNALIDAIASEVAAFLQEHPNLQL